MIYHTRSKHITDVFLPILNKQLNATSNISFGQGCYTSLTVLYNLLLDIKIVYVETWAEDYAWSITM
jgi:hypothetical protein